MKNLHKILPQLLAAAIGSWGFFCTGTVRGWSSPGIPSLNATKNFDISSSDIAWIASMPPLCALVGALLVSYPLEHFGRKKTLIGITTPFMLGFLLMGLTHFGRHKAMLYVGRLMTGLVNGALTPSSQIYISECSSPRIRGFLSSFTASALALGILVPYIVGTYVNWWILAFVMSVLPIVLTSGMIFMPETPVWLIKHHREEEARKALQRLRGKNTNIDVELKRIKDNHEKNKNQRDKIKIKDLLSGAVMKPLGISLGIMFFQQFTGINAMVFYTVSIFKSAGSSIDDHYATIIIGVVQLVSTAATGLLVDRFGRRILLITSGFIVTCSLAAMGTFFYLQAEWGVATATQKLGWLPLVSLIVFFVAYSGGYSNVPFILMGELFPSRYRSILGPLSSSFNLLCTFVIVRSFPVMQVTMTKYGAFWFFMSCTLAGMLFVYFLLPETKGKTLEDIEKFFSQTIADRTGETSRDSRKSSEVSVNQSTMNDKRPCTERDHEKHYNRSVVVDGNQIVKESPVKYYYESDLTEDEEEDDGLYYSTYL